MQLAASAITVLDNTHLTATLSPIMFAEGDEVEARNPNLPFIMSVVSVNARTGFCRCVFGYSGRDAGNFHHSELKFHGGQLIDANLAG
jgi:hypothetical protein